MRRGSIHLDIIVDIILQFNLSTVLWSLHRVSATFAIDCQSPRDLPDPPLFTGFPLAARTSSERRVENYNSRQPLQRGSRRKRAGVRAGPRAQALCERPLSWVSLLGARRRRARPGEHRRWPAVGACARERYGGPASERAPHPSIGTGIGCLEPGECGAPWLRPLPLPLADPAVLGGTRERPRGEGGRRSASSSGPRARALAARPCVTGPAVLTAARLAEGKVGVGSAGVIAIGNAGRGEAGRGGGGAGTGVGDCGAPRQRGGEEASAESARRPGVSGREVGVGSAECWD